MSVSLNKREFLFHVAFWLIHLFFRVEVGQFYEVDKATLLLIEVVELPQKMAFTYFIIYFLVPYYLKREKYLALFLFALVGLLVIILWRRIHDFYFLFPLLPDQKSLSTIEFWNVRSAVYRLIYIMPATAMGVALYFIRDWFINLRRTEKLEREKLVTELELLKGQIHPHFLFNTLNNLYTLVLKQHEHAADVVLKLSALLSYMLYEANERTVLLSKEIIHINNLIGLEKLRYGERLEYSFTVSGDHSAIRIAPLLLLPIIENAFKHGVSRSTGKVWVRIALHAENEILLLQVENSVSPDKMNETMHKGIGQKNLQRRLELLYPGKHELRIHAKDTFLVWLQVNTRA
jgi:two-component system LytT family sensor kinase